MNRLISLSYPFEPCCEVSCVVAAILMHSAVYWQVASQQGSKDNWITGVVAVILMNSAVCILTCVSVNLLITAVNWPVLQLYFITLLRTDLCFSYPFEPYCELTCAAVILLNPAKNWPVFQLSLWTLLWTDLCCSYPFEPCCNLTCVPVILLNPTVNWPLL